MGMNVDIEREIEKIVNECSEEKNDENYIKCVIEKAKEVIPIHSLHAMFLATAYPFVERESTPKNFIQFVKTTSEALAKYITVLKVLLHDPSRASIITAFSILTSLLDVFNGAFIKAIEKGKIDDELKGEVLEVMALTSALIAQLQLKVVKISEMNDRKEGRDIPSII